MDDPRTSSALESNSAEGVSAHGPRSSFRLTRTDSRLLHAYRSAEVAATARRVEVTASQFWNRVARHERLRPKQAYSDAADRRLPALSRVVVCGSVWISSKKASSLS
jgi:hypothetical protein